MPFKTVSKRIAGSEVLSLRTLNAMANSECSAAILEFGEIAGSVVVVFDLVFSVCLRIVVSSN